MSWQSPLGRPRLHLQLTDSTNVRARALALAGAPSGTLVTAREQSAGRGRQGRVWTAPPGRALLCSLLLREPPRLLTLAAGVAVAEVCGDDAMIKWPNDVLVAGRKTAGILVEGRPQEHWAVVGIGLNVAVRLQDLPVELRDRAGTLGLGPEAIEPTLALLLQRLTVWLQAPERAVLDGVRARDALLHQTVTWAGRTGIGAGLDSDGRLIVELADGSGRATLDAGDVHLVAEGQ